MPKYVLCRGRFTLRHNVMNTDAEGFTGLKHGTVFYQPMVELVQFREANDFTVYIVTATERNIVRARVKDTLGLSPARSDSNRCLRSTTAPAT